MYCRNQVSKFHNFEISKISEFYRFKKRKVWNMIFQNNQYLRSLNPKEKVLNGLLSFLKYFSETNGTIVPQIVEIRSFRNRPLTRHK